MKTKEFINVVNDELDIIEREAYEQGNIMFRNWEDSIKNEN